MTHLYWDSSAIGSLMFEEHVTKRLREFTAKWKGNPDYTSYYSFIEIESAISRRMKERSLDSEQLPEVRIQFQRIEEAIVTLWADKEILSAARRFVMEFGLRPGDALQLSTAYQLILERRNSLFVCIDAKLNRAASALGMSAPFL